MTNKDAANPMSVLCRCYVGIASVFLAAAAMTQPALAGGWEEFLKRCVTPMEAGGQPSVLELDPVDADPIGQAFALPGQGHIAIRPPFQAFGLQCIVVTKPVQAAQTSFEAWIETVVVGGRYAADAEIQSRWLTQDEITKPLAMDVWQEGDWIVFQLSYLETAS